MSRPNSYSYLRLYSYLIGRAMWYFVCFSNLYSGIIHGNKLSSNFHRVLRNIVLSWIYLSMLIRGKRVIGNRQSIIGTTDVAKLIKTFTDLIFNRTLQNFSPTVYIHPDNFHARDKIHCFYGNCQFQESVLLSLTKIS